MGSMVCAISWEARDDDEGIKVRLKTIANTYDLRTDVSNDALPYRGPTTTVFGAGVWGSRLIFARKNLLRRRIQLFKKSALALLHTLDVNDSLGQIEFLPMRRK